MFLTELPYSLLLQHHAESLQSCPTLRRYGLWPPGSSVHGVSQARTLEWVALPSPKGSS